MIATQYDEKWVLSDYDGAPMMDLRDAEVGQEIIVVYDSNYGGQVMRRGSVTDIEPYQCMKYEGVRVTFPAHDGGHIKVKAAVREEDSRYVGGWVDKVSKGPFRSLGPLIVVYDGDEQ